MTEPYIHQPYPAWVKVAGPGHPDYPGHVLVNNEDEEREAKANKPATQPVAPASPHPDYVTPEDAARGPKPEWPQGPPVTPVVPTPALPPQPGGQTGKKTT